MNPIEAADPSAPAGVAVRYPAGTAGRRWHQAAELPDGRVALAVGLCAHHDPAATRPEMGAAIRSLDPEQAFPEWRRPGATALFALVDPARSGLSFSGLGESSLTLSRPDGGHRTFAVTAGRRQTAALPPGSTLVLGSGPARWEGMLDACALLCPGEAADLLASLPTATPDLVLLVYRTAPAPLSLALPARPDSLAALRDRLGRWLSLAGLDPQSSADVVLAVGERCASTPASGATSWNCRFPTTAAGSPRGARPATAATGSS